MKQSNKEATTTEAPTTVAITPLKIKYLDFQIKGVTPYLQNKWTDSAINEMRSKMVKGTRSANKDKAKAARKFDGEWKESMHVSIDGWAGIPVAAFRGALVRACKLVGFAMTDAKLVIDIAPDGYDARGHGLIQIHGEPQNSEMMVNNSNGSPDIRCRPIWKEWNAKLTISYDSDTFSVQDVSNLLHRAGLQVGIGAGRPDSKKSIGLGYGKFALAQEAA